MPEADDRYQFAISLSVLNHLGRNLYRNFVTVLGEAISNAWDADATQVWIDIDRENDRFTISDDGSGMSQYDFQNRFLKIGYSKRKDGGERSTSGRPFIGAKGIGKLALLSCAERISIFTKTAETEYTGGVIDNGGLDEAITNDLVPDEYPLESLDFGLVDGMLDNHNQGTIIVFEGAERVLRNSEDYIRKTLALSFQFSLIDPNFTIYVNDKSTGVEDLASLAEHTQFIWTINEFSNPFVESMGHLAAPAERLASPLTLKGYIATVQKPRHLKVWGIDERVTLDLFTNGRLRERNLLRHFPTQRIVESYIYGQIHYDELDREGVDPFTSSREGVVENDEKFEALVDYLKRQVLPRVLDDWDRLRLSIADEGDGENPRKTRKERSAANFVIAAEEEYRSSEGAGGGGGGSGDEGGSGQEGGGPSDPVDSWLLELRPDAVFNLAAYMDCFMSENLLRKFLKHGNTQLSTKAQAEVSKYRAAEIQHKSAVNMSFIIRRDDDDLGFLSMDELAMNVEGSDGKGKNMTLWKDAKSYKPVRNAVGHTGVLSDPAKAHLSVTFENIKARVKTIINGD